MKKIGKKNQGVKNPLRIVTPIPVSIPATAPIEIEVPQRDTVKIPLNK